MVRLVRARCLNATGLPQPLAIDSATCACILLVQCGPSIPRAHTVAVAEAASLISVVQLVLPAVSRTTPILKYTVVGCGRRGGGAPHSRGGGGGGPQGGVTATAEQPGFATHAALHSAIVAFFAHSPECLSQGPTGPYGSSGSGP